MVENGVNKPLSCHSTIGAVSVTDESLLLEPRGKQCKFASLILFWPICIFLKEGFGNMGVLKAMNVYDLIERKQTIVQEPILQA